MCYSLWYNAPTMLPAGSLEADGNEFLPPLPGYRPATSSVHYTTSCNTHTHTHTHTHAHTSAPEDGRDCRSKHVKLIGIINKPLLLHLVGCLYYLNQLTSYFVTERRTGAEVAGIPPGSRAANLRMRLTSPVGSIHEKNTNLVAMDTYLPPHSSE